MQHFEVTQLTAAYRQRCEDRIGVFHDGERVVVAIADGAGGIGEGAAAAEAAIREIECSYPHIASAVDWTILLRQIDQRIGPGESTAVVVDLQPNRLCGASVGDSVAWIVHEDQITELTVRQHRKPLLGSGGACPVSCELSGSLQGTLLVTSDGFANYAKRDDVTRLVATADFVEIPRRAIEMVRLPSGDLWDDTAVVAVRVRRPQRPRRRYSI